MFSSQRRRRKHCSTDMWIKDRPLTTIAPSDHTSVTAQPKRQSIGMWKTNGLMTRTDIAKTRTICKGRLRSTTALTEEWLQMSLSTSLLNADVAQEIERSFRMREERGSTPRISNYSEKTGNQETNTTGSCLVRSKKNIDKYVQYSMGSIWNSSA